MAAAAGKRRLQVNAVIWTTAKDASTVTDYYPAPRIRAQPFRATGVTRLSLD